MQLISLNKNTQLAIALFCYALLLTACGGGGGSGPATSANNNTVDESLAALGVDTEQTPRVDEDQDPLPTDYSPLRSAQTIDKFDELFLVGFPLDASFGISNPAAVIEQVVDNNNNFDSELLLAPNTSDTPWAVSGGANPDYLRAITQADIDGDGLEEMIVCYQLAGESEVHLQVIDDLENGFTFLPSQLVSTQTVQDIQLTQGDFNGDGLTDIAIGLVLPGSAELLLINNNQGLLEITGTTISINPISAATTLALSMDAGNLDYDNPDELVVVFNEYFQQGSGINPDTGVSRYYLYDDANALFAELSSGAIVGDGATATRTAITADVSIGDIDGDNVDEVVFGGLTNFAPTLNCEYGYLMVALDDLNHQLSPLGADYREPFGDGDWSCINTSFHLRHLHVNTLDLDNDGADEIQANQFVFQNFRSAAPWTDLYSLPRESLFRLGDDLLTGDYTRHNSTIVTTDVTNDKRDNVVVYSQLGEVAIWGLDSLNETWRQMGEILTQPVAAGEMQRPIVVAANVDHDSLALQYSTGKYQLIFTEPVLIAALAAAPCSRSLGQNEDSCRTGFGTAESDSVSTESTFTVTAGYSLGFSSSFDVGGVEVADFEAIASVKASLANKSIESYTLTKRVEYESGPIEDTVIFTSIPYDQYTYTILSHPDSKYIGVDIVLSMPRAPVQILVERDFYNQNAVDGSIMIDESIFEHRNGDPWSYPSASQKDQLLSRFEGFETTQVDVGQGTGSVGVGINVFNESGSSTAYGIEGEFELQATASGVLAGFSIGFSNEDELQISHGDESDYSGAVGNLSSSAFATDAYSYGLFTYVYEHPRQPFEVINYWVE